MCESTVNIRIVTKRKENHMKELVAAEKDKNDNELNKKLFV